MLVGTTGRKAISWTPDGKIVFRSWAKGANDVWVVERDGSNLKQLMVNDTRCSGTCLFHPTVTTLCLNLTAEVIVISGG